MLRRRQQPSLFRRWTLLALCLATAALALTLASRRSLPAADASGVFTLRVGDHIAILGNTLADRMQHDGWLEAMLYQRFPKHNLVIRNLGFSGDELTLRLRSQSFGTPDEWLTKCKADVILAFFGYNESFAGQTGLEKFKKDLEAFIKQTLAQKYNGKSAPRLVLFSPPAFENHESPNLPDGGEINLRLALYAKAMAEVAQTNKIPFVDLFKATGPMYEKFGGPKKRLTINGVHLTEEGNQRLAAVIEKELFVDTLPALDTIKNLRKAILDKNFYWFNRYRTTDGYSIYGGRADLKFVRGQTNREVMQREMEVLDVMTAYRDKRIWAIASSAGKTDPPVNDDDTPPFIPVETNKPGAGPGGHHIFLDGEQSIQKMTVAKNFKVNLFASEKEFPELANPVQMTWDTRGRLWVAVWPTYPHWKPKEEMNDKLLILEDTDGDGKADKCTTFAGNLHNPTGFEFVNGGVLVAQTPDLLFLKDTDGDDKADVRQRVIHGLCSADTHHASNSFVRDPGGAIYFQEGTFHHTQVETPYGPPERCANAGVFRYEPRTQKFEVYVSYGFANPHGHVFDRWGQDIVVDGTGANPYHAALFSGRVEFPQKHNRPPQVYQQRTRPCSGMEYLSSRHFPDEMQGHLLVANVIGFQGILRYKINDKDSSFAGVEQEPLLSSTDPHFRPTDIKIGPDGAIYFCDWQNPIIGHMQHNLRDPSRDRVHGRVYRVTYQDRPLLKPVPIADQPIASLLDLFKEPEERVRYRARIELGNRKTEEVLPALAKWVAALDKDHADYDHNILEALWLHQNHNVPNADLLQRSLTSKDFRARAAATRVLCYWRDRSSSTLEQLKKLAADPHSRVRLEAVRAASFFKVPEAVEIPLIAMESPSDLYLDFTRGETMRTLDPYVKKAIADGKTINFTTTAGARFFLKNVGNDDLLKMKRTQGVFLEMLFRKGFRDEARREALIGLADQANKTPMRVLVDAIRNQDEQQNAQDESVVFDLVRLLTSLPTVELTAARSDLEKLATSARLPVTRQLGYVALLAADGNIDKVWALAGKSVGALQDLVHAMPLVRDPGLRAALYPKVEPLLRGLPTELAAITPKGKTTAGRFIRIELPGPQRTLTLAEVEVISAGRNVARQGRASQKNTGHGGEASRAIDGNKSGTFSDNGQTHSQEGTLDPWWEVDLGVEYPIEEVVIYNRTDGNLGTRLRGYTLKVLDKNRKEVFAKQGLPTPDIKAVIPVGGEAPERLLRVAAMMGITTVRGKEADAFKALTPFVGDDAERPVAIQALLRIPARDWPKEEASPLLGALLKYIRKVPTAERTSPAVLDALQLADSLAALLPPLEARDARKELGELGVRILRLGTVTDQMLFDKERLVVQAGKPVEIFFENTDLMPHNFVILQPGALEEVGLLGEASATQPGALERQYVPPSGKILLASRLLQPREAQKLAFMAPRNPGIYPYVCTYPGHWRRMFGALYVVADLEDYLTDGEAYMAKHPMPVVDPLLKYNRPRKEWKFEELSGAVEHLGDGHPRSFNNGKNLFTVANCVACHKFNGVGIEMGPDLTKIDPKQDKPIEILRDILEPSLRINEKYQAFTFETNGGKVITGLILEETPQMVKVIENPLAKTAPIVLKKSDIAERKKAPSSIMPKGMVDKLTQEEILDLIAYVAAKGNPKHRVFNGAHGHGH